MICILHESVEGFHSRGQHTCKFTETKGSVYIRKEFNSQGLVWYTNMVEKDYLDNKVY